MSYDKQTLTEIGRKGAALTLSLFLAAPGWAADMLIKPEAEAFSAPVAHGIDPVSTSDISNSRALTTDLAAPAATAAKPANSAAPASQEAQAAPTAQDSLKSLTGSINASKADGGNGAANLAQTFDDALPGVGLPLDWVQAANTEAANVPSSVEKSRKRLQHYSYRAGMINPKVLEMYEKNPNYTHALAQGPIENQAQSGRCWEEGSCSMIVYGKEDVSRVFNYYYAMLEKSNRYLETVISASGKPRRPSLATFGKMMDDRVQDGGDFEDVAFLVDKYGLVPAYAMKETAGSKNTMNVLHDYYLGDIKDELQAATVKLRADAGRTSGLAAAIKGETVKRVVSILQAHLGVPPSKVEYPEGSGRFITPQQYAREVVGFKSSDYVVVSSYPHQKRGKYYREKDSSVGVTPQGQPTYNLDYLSVSPKRMEQLVVASIKGGKPVAFAADVTNNFDAKTGIMHRDIFDRSAVYGNGKPSLTHAQKFSMGETSPDHMMLFTGVDQPNPKKLYEKIRFQNSWARTWGTNGDGHLYPSAFKDNVYEIVVRREFLSDAERKIFEANRE